MTLIVADTTCGLPHQLLEERGIPAIPQVVMFGEESYHDDRDFDTAAFLQKLKAFPTLPKTAAPEPSLYYPVFEQAQKKGESVVVVAPTGKASGTARSAETAALDFPAVDIRVVDTQTISCNLASMVLVADDLAKAGRSADEIVAKLADMIPCGRLLRRRYAGISRQGWPHRWGQETPGRAAGDQADSPGERRTGGTV